jgi:hypothetical protein
MRRYLLIYFLVAGVSALSQHVIKGVVTDSDTGAPIPNVLVKIIVPDTKPTEIIQYTSTDASGQYSLAFTTTLKNVEIEFSLLGYKNEKRAVKTESQTVHQKLTSSPIEIKEVTVKGPVISSRGDTLNYNVAAFKTPADKTVEDILKKLPGITISGTGQIKYQGEPINKFYIEGLDMLEGKYNMATQNIRADQITTVQVFENHQPVKLLQNIRLTDRAAINIKLTNNRMSRPAGTVLLGAGYSDEFLYRGNLFGFMANREQQALYTLKGDNSGFFTFKNEFQNQYAGNEKHIKAETLISPMPLSLPSQIDAQSGREKALLSSVNTIRKIDENSSVKFNLSYAGSDMNYKNEKITDYYVEDKEIIINENQNSSIVENKINTMLTFEKNAETLYIKDNLEGNLNFGKSGMDILSLTGHSQSYKMKEFDFRNNLNVMFKVGKNQYGFTSSLFGGKIPDNQLRITSSADNLNPVIQYLSGHSFYTEHTTYFNRSLSSKSILKLDLKMETEHDNINTELEKNSGQPPVKNLNRGNKITFQLIPAYNFRYNRFSMGLQIPVKLFLLSFKDDILESHFQLNRIKTDGRLNVAYKFSPFINMRSSASIVNSLGDIMDFVGGEVQKSYNRSSVLSSGVLEQNRRIGYNLGYEYKHTMNGVFSSFNIAYSNVEKNIMNGSNISTAGDVSFVSRESKTLSDNLMGYFYVGKNIKPLKTVITLSSNYAYSKANRLRQGVSVDYTNHLLSFRPSVSFWYFDWLSVKSWGEIELSELSVGMNGLKSPQNYDVYTMNGEITVLPVKNVELFYKITYSNNPLTEEGKREQLYFMDCGARYQPSKSLELELSVYNFTDNKRYTSTVYQELEQIKTTYYLRPASVILSIKFRY